MGIASFELLHINYMAMSRNIRKLEKKLYMKLLKNSNRYRNFVAGSFDKYVSNLSTDREWADNAVSNLLADREWADNAAIQATSNAFPISIEILND